MTTRSGPIHIAIMDNDVNGQFVNWHKDDGNDHRPGGEHFGWCQGDAKQVLRAWEWLSSIGNNSIQGKPITLDELKKSISNDKEK